MLRITPSVNAEAAKSYYNEGLTKEGRESYYGKDSPGVWGGRGAARLQLAGVVTREHFESLADNRRPGTGDRLTARNRDGRTVGWDFTFSVPKSVSVYYALSGDASVREAFEAAVEETMREIESEAMTRVRKDGMNGERRADGLVWASYTHYNSRPIEGVHDPHLHRHVYVFNASWDGEENAWKSVYLREIKRQAPYHQAAFDARFAEKLAAMGIGVDRRARGGWELAAVPDSVVAKFSRRTAEIEAEAKAKGITSDIEKDKLGARTRQQKTGAMDAQSMLREWRARLSPSERAALEAVRGKVPERDASAVDRALAHAVQHAFERSSVVSEKRLLAEALCHGVGRVGVEAVKKAFAGRSDIIRHQVQGQDLATTKEVLADEQAILAFVREGRGRHRSLARPDFEFKPQFLNEQQARAVRFVLASQDRVLGIRGGAGVGKSTLMKIAVQALEQNGHCVRVFAPTAQASRGVLRQEGFDNAETVQKLLQDEDLQHEMKNGVVWIDEAGLLGAKALAQVFSIAKEQNARVILSGDYGQMHSVERGDAFRLLHKVGGMAMVEVREIQRQKGAYKQAVEALARGKLEEGFARLDALGAFVQMDGTERYRQLAEDYVAAISQGKSALAVTPMHREAEEVKGRIRDELRAHGLLEGGDRRLERLKSLQWTLAEKADGHRYQKGDVVQFHNHLRGFRRGERARVEEVAEDGTVWTRNARGERAVLPLGRAKLFDVYEAKAVDVASGDRIRFTQNGQTLDKKHRLNNGASYRIEGFTRDGHLRLENGWIVNRDYAHLDLAYVSTAHSSQGQTVDRVFLAQSSLSTPAASQEAWYVSVSRGREMVRIYTDSKAELRASIEKSGIRLAAVELEQKAKRPADWFSLLRQRVRHAEIVKHRQSDFIPNKDATRTAGREHER